MIGDEFCHTIPSKDQAGGRSEPSNFSGGVSGVWVPRPRIETMGEGFEVSLPGEWKADSPLSPQQMSEVRSYFNNTL